MNCRADYIKKGDQNKKLNMDKTKQVFFIFSILNVYGYNPYGLNLSPIVSNQWQTSNPTVIQKVSRLPPAFNIVQKSSKIPVSTPSPHRIPKLPTKPPPLSNKLKSTNAKCLNAPLTRKPRFAPLLPPLIPPLPLLPLPILPLLPPPILPLPFIPNIFNPLKPIRLPTLWKKTSLEKTLKSIGKSKKVKLSDNISGKKNILEKLLDLKRKGSLTTAEFIRFKKLLLR